MEKVFYLLIFSYGSTIPEIKEENSSMLTSKNIKFLVSL